MTHYPIEIVNNNERLRFIWYSDDNNDYLICENAKLKSFKTYGDLEKYCLDNKLILDKTDHIKEYDFDIIKTWINSQIALSDNDILDFWNLFIDISVSLNCIFSGDKNDELRNAIYEKLCDSVIWCKENEKHGLNDSDKKIIAGYFKDGLEIFENNK